MARWHGGGHFSRPGYTLGGGLHAQPAGPPPLAPALYSVCATADGGDADDAFADDRSVDPVTGLAPPEYDPQTGQMRQARPAAPPTFHWVALPAGGGGDPDADTPCGDAATFADAVAAASARFPDAAFAGEALAAQHLGTSDPLVALFDAIDRHGRPPVQWVVRWSAGGAREPLAAAWRASRAPGLMLTLCWHRPGGGALLARLVAAGAMVEITAGGVTVSPGYGRRARHANPFGGGPAGPPAGPPPLTRAGVLAMLHEANPSLPTLAEVLARSDAARARGAGPGMGGGCRGTDGPVPAALAPPDGADPGDAPAYHADGALVDRLATLDAVALDTPPRQIPALLAALRRDLAASRVLPAAQRAALDAALAAYLEAFEAGSAGRDNLPLLARAQELARACGGLLPVPGSAASP